MPHRLEILNIRDRYMIGDWVLNNGKPYRWTADDYNRSKMGMEAIKPMPLTEEILLKNVQDGEELDCVDFEYPNGSDGFILHVYNDAELIIHVVYIHEAQDALRVCKLYDLAENFKV